MFSLEFKKKRSFDINADKVLRTVTSDAKERDSGQ